jgi:hypothetical protein
LFLGLLTFSAVLLVLLAGALIILLLPLVPLVSSTAFIIVNGLI